MMTEHIEKTAQYALTTLVVDYLQGKNLSQIRTCLDSVCAQKGQSAHALYAHIPARPIITRQLLTLLQVPIKKQNTYLNINHLLPMLTYLHQAGYEHDHLNYLLQLIQKTSHQPYKATFILNTTLIISTVGVLFYKNPHSMNIPFLGMLYTSYSLATQMYQTFYYGCPNINPTLLLFFIQTASSCLSLSAYVLCFLTAGVTTSMTAFLFISSSFLTLLEHVLVFYLIKQKTSPAQTAYVQNKIILANHARHQYQQQLTSESLGIKLYAALLTTIASALWCLHPPSFLITISCITYITCINWIKTRYIEELSTRELTTLQTSLASIHASPQTPSTSITHISFFNRPNTDNVKISSLDSSSTRDYCRV
ncbi:MAG: hypothetical protein A3F46_11245 [Legionellales bacterium RIFCSPHIGHO2_12_FULL_42_9]|nr:MAG: hypothetical protein A3F46_11245 [Legionellales bacterium RIFCSPHIGHO2_12_FULL_42_9]